jgi:hypothetical protein
MPVALFLSQYDGSEGAGLVSSQADMRLAMNRSRFWITLVGFLAAGCAREPAPNDCVKRRLAQFQESSRNGKVATSPDVAEARIRTLCEKEMRH